jgi:hypothetical protein
MRTVLGVAAVVGFACTIPPPPRHPTRLLETKKVNGIMVAIVTDGPTGWDVSVHNDRDDPVHLLWDESSYVDGDGRSYGRLLRGQTRITDATRPQMPSVIAPHALITEFCIPESMPEWHHDGRSHDPTPLPEAVTKGIGRFVLVFEFGGIKEHWEGAVSLDGSDPDIFFKRAPPAGGFYCVTADDLGASFCQRHKDACEVARGDGNGCVPQRTAWCYERGAKKVCGPSQAACIAARDRSDEAASECVETR